jgi:hypothetical protein
MSTVNTNAKAAAVNWTYDATPINLIGPHDATLQNTPHFGEHHVAEYKGHKLRILRVVSKRWPDEAHSQLQQTWQGELDGVAVPELVGEQSNPIAEALVARVDALP